jgi:DNA-directed RNA polymerase specialized sigma24 family protein
MKARGSCSELKHAARPYSAESLPSKSENGEAGGMMGATTTGIFTRPEGKRNATQEYSEVFEEWFWRCRGLLHFTACRVLGGSEGAQLAVLNCWLTASRNSAKFDREGAFRSWLLRVLIDEALILRRQAKAGECVLNAHSVSEKMTQPVAAKESAEP